MQERGHIGPSTLARVHDGSHVGRAPHPSVQDAQQAVSKIRRGDACAAGSHYAGSA